MDAHGNTTRKGLLVLNCALLALGTCGSPLLMRLYFIHGGKRVWFCSFLETAGFPILLLPITVNYLLRRITPSPPSTAIKVVSIRWPLFTASAVIGVLIGLDDYFYAYGVARLPVSTSSLLIATQLAFTAGFAFLLVRQRFTSYSTNAIFLLTIGAVVLALHTSSDRPDNESNREYVLGFVMTLAASALYGFSLPLVELTYKKAKQVISYPVVMEIQVVISLFATGFCAVGMLVNDDFKAIGREAIEYELGEARYYLVVVWTAIITQFFFLGAIGVIFCASSLLSGIIIAVLLPVTEVLAVIFFHERFQSEKGVALALSLWGFVSYFYGEIKRSKKKVEAPETEMPQTHIP